MKEHFLKKVFGYFVIFAICITMMPQASFAQLFVNDVIEDPDQPSLVDDFILTGPTMTSYKAISNNDLEMFFTTNYTSDYCGLQYVKTTEPLGFDAAGFNHADIYKTPSQRGDNLYEYRGVIKEFEANVAYYVRPYCKYEDQARSDGDIIYVKEVQEASPTFIAKGPTVVNYSQNTSGDLEFTFTANFDGTCWGQYDSTNLFTNASNVATSLIENPSSANGYLYKYKAVLSNLTVGSTYFVRPYCAYDGGYYSGTDFSWVHSALKEPSITITSKELDSNSRLNFAWETYGLSSCSALLSTQSDYSQRSAITATRTELGSDAYKFKADVGYLNNTVDYYMQVNCTKDNQTYSSAWSKVTKQTTSSNTNNNTSNTNPPAEQEEQLQINRKVELKPLRIDDDNNILIKIESEFLASCEGEMSINADKSNTSILSTRSQHDGVGNYKFETEIPSALPNTIYYVRAQCVHDGKMYYSDWRGIASSGPAQDNPTTVPTVKYVVKQSNGIIGFQVNADYRAACGIQYSRFDNMTPGFLVEASSYFGENPYKYSVFLTQLQENTTYYYRPYCKINNRTLIGDINSLETPRRTESRSDAIADARSANNASDDVVNLSDNTNAIAVIPIRQRLRDDAVSQQAEKLAQDRIEELLSENEQLKNKLRESQVRNEYLQGLLKRAQNNVPEEIQNALTNFITYGSDAKTIEQGERQRGSVIYSYEEAYGRLPETEDEVADVILLAQGNAPFIRNEEAEKKAFKDFETIYYRVPDLSDPYDKNAVTIMAYGMLNGGPRNIASEAAALATYRDVFDAVPQTTRDWNLLRAITYSGSARCLDSDGDRMCDKHELKIGSNPQIADTDGDGYPDGTEYITGYNVNGPGRL